MSASPEDIANAIALYVQTVSGLRTVTDPTSIVNPPVAAVLPPSGAFIDYTVSFEHPVAEYEWRIIVAVSHAHDRVSLPALYGYIAPGGPSSIPAALLADPTLGKTVDYCIPLACMGPRIVPWNGVDYLTSEIICKVGAE